METSADHLPRSLRELVSQTVEVLGSVIRRELGDERYERIESLRLRLVELRQMSRAQAAEVLREIYKDLAKLSARERLEIARAFTFMLEVMNACENAYRSHRIANRKLDLPDERPDSIVYVLTAHPTESRSPGNIAVFHEVLKELIPFIGREPMFMTDFEKDRLRHSLELAWKTKVVRVKKPRVQDEADHIYSTLLREETLRTVLHASRDLAPIFIRSWVGGDKDGHPGVDEKVFIESLSKSRKLLVAFVHARLTKVRSDLEITLAKSLNSPLKKLDLELKQLSRVSSGDGQRLARFRKSALRFAEAYVKEMGVLHPDLEEIKMLLHLFPALVVPLEFREASDVLLSDATGKTLAIVRMLKTLKQVCKAVDPRWYVRGFIVSMTNEVEHLEAAAKFVVKVFGAVQIPVIPLFEQASALEKSSEIVIGMVKSPLLGPAIKKEWRNQVELMLGYSDSAKESGVLRSRVQVNEAIHALDQTCEKLGVKPIFFHGSGGSTDRGGGSIQEQTAWWPKGALRNYKVTVQGEMVERFLASPEITRGQIERIVQSTGGWRSAQPLGDLVKKENPALRQFADKVASLYQETVHDPKFLEVIADATPYPFLDLLKIGSRPTKRSKTISVEGLRAIPWILCWTQTRTMFPTWWGVGRAWSQAIETEKRDLRSAAKTSKVFQVYLSALAQTFAKVRLSIWRIYLDQSVLDADHREDVWNQFCREFDDANAFVSDLHTREETWLDESIHLRSPMIHPLNLLQILAMKERDEALLTVTVTGISAGLQTTG